MISIFSAQLCTLKMVRSHDHICIWLKKTSNQKSNNLEMFRGLARLFEIGVSEGYSRAHIEIQENEES